MHLDVDFMKNVPDEAIYGKQNGFLFSLHSRIYYE